MPKQHIPEAMHREMPFEDMMRLFETLSFKEKWTKVRYGIKQPKESGEYKWAALQIKRLISPAAAVLVPSFSMLLLVVLAGMAPQLQQGVNIRIMDEQHIQELEDIDIPDPDVPPPDPEHIIEPMENFIPSTSKSQVGPDVDFSPQPAQFDSVAIIRSPVVMRGIFGTRSPGARGSALGRFGGGGHTEAAVLRALRWLKKYQEEDGGWAGNSGDGAGAGGNRVKPAMTGMALLAFLAHGETPASPEFGKTVEGAIRYLVENPNWPTAYQWPIATYALAEAYGMTRIPSIRPVAEKGLDRLIAGQGPPGGWTYALNAAEPNDGSINGWCVQALKAGHMAGLERPGLEQAMKRAVQGWGALFRGNSERGGFGYSGPAIGNPTPGGALSLQLLGELNNDHLRGAVHYLSQRQDGNQVGGEYRNVYWTYYHTQVMFHEGGETWRNWNKAFSVPLVNAQNIIPNAIADLQGKMVDIGYWETNNAQGGRVMDTALCALQLMVYYRYLPTFQSPDQIIAAEGGSATADAPKVVEAQDLDINMQL